MVTDWLFTFVCIKLGECRVIGLSHEVYSLKFFFVGWYLCLLFRETVYLTTIEADCHWVLRPPSLYGGGVGGIEILETVG